MKNTDVTRNNEKTKILYTDVIRMNCSAPSQLSTAKLFLIIILRSYSEIKNPFRIGGRDFFSFLLNLLYTEDR